MLPKNYIIISEQDAQKLQSKDVDEFLKKRVRLNEFQDESIHNSSLETKNEENKKSSNLKINSINSNNNNKKAYNSNSKSSTTSIIMNSQAEIEQFLAKYDLDSLSQGESINLPNDTFQFIDSNTKNFINKYFKYSNNKNEYEEIFNNLKVKFIDARLTNTKFFIQTKMFSMFINILINDLSNNKTKKYLPNTKYFINQYFLLIKDHISLRLLVKIINSYFVKNSYDYKLHDTKISDLFKSKVNVIPNLSSNTEDLTEDINENAISNDEIDLKDSSASSNKDTLSPTKYIKYIYPSDTTPSSLTSTSILQPSFSSSSTSNFNGNTGNFSNNSSLNFTKNYLKDSPVKSSLTLEKYSTNENHTGYKSKTFNKILQNKNLIALKLAIEKDILTSPQDIMFDAINTYNLLKPLDKIRNNEDSYREIYTYYLESQEDIIETD